MCPIYKKKKKKNKKSSEIYTRNIWEAIYQDK